MRAKLLLLISLSTLFAGPVYAEDEIDEPKETRREWLSRRSDCLLVVVLAAVAGTNYVRTEYNEAQLEKLASKELPREIDRFRLTNQYQPEPMSHVFSSVSHRYYARQPGILLVPRRESASKEAKEIARLSQPWTARSTGYVLVGDHETVSQPHGIVSPLLRDVEKMISLSQVLKSHPEQLREYAHLAQAKTWIADLIDLRERYPLPQPMEPTDTLLAALRREPPGWSRSLSPVEARLLESLSTLESYCSELSQVLVRELNLQYPAARLSAIYSEADGSVTPKAWEEVHFGLHEGAKVQNILKKYVHAAARGYDLVVLVEPETLPRIYSLLAETFALSAMPDSPLAIWDFPLRQAPHPQSEKARQSDALVYFLTSQQPPWQERFSYVRAWEKAN